MVARALAIVHTCIYDAWAAYDERARGTQTGRTLAQPYGLRTLKNKKEVISFAAYRAVVDLFPLEDATVYRPLMTSLGYDPDNTTTDITTPAGVGNTVCAAVLQFRHNDGSNQLGHMSSSGVPYSDYTGYESVNPPATVPVNLTSILDPNRWQPLQYTDPTGQFVTQVFLRKPHLRPFVSLATHSRSSRSVHSGTRHGQPRQPYRPSPAGVASRSFRAVLA
jgi:hypothetical protein